MKNKPYYPIIHRLLHWSLALPMILIFLTIALHDGWMDKNHMASLMEAGLLQVDIELDKEQLIKIAKSIRNAMFEWHYYAGYVIGVVLLLGLLIQQK